MRIVIIGRYPVSTNANWTGPMNVGYHLSHELAKRSNKVSVFVHANLGFQGRGLLVDIEENLRVRKVTFLDLARWISSDGVEVVLLQGLCPLSVLWRIAGHRKVVFRPSGLVSRERNLGCEHSLKNLWNERISLGVPIVICQSSLLRQAILTDYGLSSSRIFVIPNGVSRYFLRDDPNHELRIGQSFDRKILFVGNLGYWKGVDFLLKTVDLLVRQFGSTFLQLLLVGASTEWFNSLRQEFDHLFRQGIILHLLPQPWHIIKQLYRSAAIVVLPSRFEAFGNVALEAMACGTPVIISDRVGMRDLIENGKEGHIVPFGDVKAMAEKICFLISHEDVRKRMAKDAKTTASHFTWSNAAAIYENLFRRFVVQ